MPLGTKVGVGPGDIALDKSQGPRVQKGTPLNFRPMSTVAKRSPISATAELLLGQVKVKSTILYEECW